MALGTAGVPRALHYAQDQNRQFVAQHITLSNAGLYPKRMVAKQVLAQKLVLAQLQPKTTPLLLKPDLVSDQYTDAKRSRRPKQRAARLPLMIASSPSSSDRSHFLAKWFHVETPHTVQAAERGPGTGKRWYVLRVEQRKNSIAPQLNRSS